jgi:sulfate transport system substrate-binding protein
VIVPNPKTSGNGHLALPAWACAVRGGKVAAAAEFVKALFQNVPLLETGGRAATGAFVKKEIGDVLLTFERGPANHQGFRISSKWFIHQ